MKKLFLNYLVSYCYSDMSHVLLYQDNCRIINAAFDSQNILLQSLEETRILANEKQLLEYES